MSTGTTFTPSQADVFAVREILLDYVPAELALIIVELAEYWPKISATREALSGPATVPSINRGSEWCYIVSPPLPYFPGTITAPRRVKFTLECAVGCTFDKICSNYTLFNAAIVKSKDMTQNTLYEPMEANPERHVRSDMLSDPSRWLVKDIPLGWPVGSREEIEWDCAIGNEPSLFDNLACGDRVALMVKGIRPGWVNCVYNVTTEVFYSI